MQLSKTTKSWTNFIKWLLLHLSRLKMWRWFQVRNLEAVSVQQNSMSSDCKQNKSIRENSGNIGQAWITNVFIQRTKQHTGKFNNIKTWTFTKDNRGWWVYLHGKSLHQIQASDQHSPGSRYINTEKSLNIKRWLHRENPEDSCTVRSIQLRNSVLWKNESEINL